MRLTVKHNKNALEDVTHKSVPLNPAHDVSVDPAHVQPAGRLEHETAGTKAPATAHNRAAATHAKPAGSREERQIAFTTRVNGRRNRSGHGARTAGCGGRPICKHFPLQNGALTASRARCNLGERWEPRWDRAKTSVKTCTPREQVPPSLAAFAKGFPAPAAAPAKNGVARGGHIRA